VAAANALTRINSALELEPIVADLTAANAVGLLAGVDVIVDGTDNFEARFLVNEVACRERIPWGHGGAIGVEPPNGRLGSGLRRRQKNATEAGAGRFEKPAPDARTAPPEAHESLISRKTGAEVPLTGLSFLGNRE
jgi:hypothetical protein